MKRSILIILQIMLFSGFISAQNLNKTSVGFQINQHQNDFGVGLHLVSPYFANQKAAITVSTNIQWLEHLKSDEWTWSPYGHVKLGFRGRQPIIEDKIFVYGEGGLLLLIPNTEFSSKKSQAGGYGLFGFEFHTGCLVSFYLELGAMGTGAKADKLRGNPIYSNGFTSSVGMRIKWADATSCQ